MAQNKKDVSYQQALLKIEKIIKELQGETVDVDQLSVKLKEAYNLIEVCRAKIKSAETEIKKINK
jgi:exodeoxyribonuclease VII small subunit